MIVGGAVSNGSSQHLLVGRYDADGSRDLAFGSGGKTTMSVGVGEKIQALAVQPDGRIVGTGFLETQSDFETLTVRFLSNGLPDSGFGTVITQASSGNDFGLAVALDAAGRVVIAGRGQESFFDFFTVSRLNADQSTVSVASGVSVQFGSVTMPGITRASVRNETTLPPFPNGLSLMPNTTAYDISSNTIFSGNATVTFSVPSIASSAVCASMRVAHFTGASWTTAGSSSVYDQQSQVCTVSMLTSSFSPFAVVQLAPTAAGVSVSGRVAMPDGRGLRGALVKLRRMDGTVISTRTSAFGDYRFDGVPAGELCLVSASSRKFVIDGGEKVFVANDSVSDVNFTASKR